MKTLRFILATTIFVALSIPKQAHGHSVEVRGKGLVVDGHQFIVKGIHYGPWRPGTGPGKGYPYPGPEAIESDLRVIRSMHVNTILVVDPPGYVLDLAERNDLKVLYSFYVNWWTLGTKEAAPARNNVLQQVQNYRDKPAFTWLGSG